MVAPTDPAADLTDTPAAGGDDAARLAHLRELARGIVAGRRCILAGPPVAGQTGNVALLRSLGSDRCLVIGPNRGTGPLPDTADADWLSLDLPPAEDVVAGMHHMQTALEDLAPGVRERIEVFDPDGRALVMVAGHVSDIRELAGRADFGTRRPEWARYEDKVAIDAFWERAGLPHAPAEVVPVEREALQAAHARLDRGEGTVWAGDAREGLHGGATCIRHVRQPADVDDAVAFFATRCDRVRVMPFMEGLPCSIHGMVLGDAVIVFRPMEMITLRRPGATGFVYAGAASYWDPAPADREAMRDFARRTGERLHEEAGYRGGFTVDGVMTADGFRPTELNARSGAALNQLTRAIDGLPYGLIERAVREGLDLDFRPADLEALIVGASDRQRTGGTWMSTTTPATESTQHGVVADAEAADGYRLAREGETPDVTLLVGPGGTGSFVRAVPQPGHVAPGPPFSPRAVQLLALADRAFGLGIGTLEPAMVAR